jgi:hypothetical protein
MNEQNCSEKDCLGDWFASCAHGDFCAEHWENHLVADTACNVRWMAVWSDAAKLMRGLGKLSEKHFPLRAAALLQTDAICESFTAVLSKIYEDAGAPNGFGDDAMFAWIEELNQPGGAWLH